MVAVPRKHRAPWSARHCRRLRCSAPQYSRTSASPPNLPFHLSDFAAALFRSCSSPGPLRRALLNECLDPDSKVVAAVAGAHEIIAVGQGRVHDAADRFLAHAHGGRGLLRKPGGELGNAPIEIPRLDDFA